MTFMQNSSSHHLSPERPILDSANKKQALRKIRNPEILFDITPIPNHLM